MNQLQHLLGAEAAVKAKAAKTESGTKAWLTKPVVGPLPRWGAITVGLLALSGLGYFLRRHFSR